MDDLFDGIGDLFSGLYDLVGDISDIGSDIFSSVSDAFDYLMKCLRVIEAIMLLVVLYQILRLSDVLFVPFFKGIWTVIKYIFNFFRNCCCPVLEEDITQTQSIKFNLEDYQ